MLIPKLMKMVARPPPLLLIVKPPDCRETPETVVVL